MDQGDPVRKREAHAPSEERLTGKREREKETGDHGRMIEPPRHERSGSAYKCHGDRSVEGAFCAGIGGRAISRKAVGCESVTSGRSSKWAYIPVGMYSRILSSVVQPVELGETTGHVAHLGAVECVRAVSGTLYLALSSLGEIVVECVDVLNRHRES
ncbi:hypothetical protein DBV15_03882 [Temnothorax longispinosus]|uniref:Uncharacterized protein n=1 Tax=Temnothorax longispinosus TaxID=300112 RepID=A0A4S2JS02_9HYME|nr:hypothetical protein DBV15_03882 [Temnothorax longispinosus]